MTSREVSESFAPPPSGGFLSQFVRDRFGLGDAPAPAISLPFPLRDDWRVGLVTGPSGAGKSRLSRVAFPGAQVMADRWPDEQPVIEAFASLGSDEATRRLGSVGLLSPRSWVLPFCALSTGQQARALLALSLLSGPGTLIVDEFTHALDPLSAEGLCRTLNRSLPGVGVRCVFISARPEVARWLGHDWLCDAWARCLCPGAGPRPAEPLTIRDASASDFPPFAPEHYLPGDLHPASQCFVGEWRGRPACFGAMLQSLGHRGRMRVTRLTVHDFAQGMGFGSAMLGHLTRKAHGMGKGLSLVTSHPAMVAHALRNVDWRHCYTRNLGCSPHGKSAVGRATSHGRAVAGFLCPAPDSPGNAATMTPGSGGAFSRPLA